ncbi:hypothetical protein MKX07_005367 [Trichoderma sp. CBMAI-0711]|nr:hypothetical protein MKX07_005367 [Trichoderma sp. CBMAI-0711]
MMPRSRAYAAAALYTAKLSSWMRAAYFSPTMETACSGEMFSSFSPAGAFVDGVYFCLVSFHLSLDEM